MTLITHNLQGGELKPISCAQMQDLFCNVLINLRFIHSMQEGEHTNVFCARGDVCVVCEWGGTLPKILHTPQQMCSCAPAHTHSLVLNACFSACISVLAPEIL